MDNLETDKIVEFIKHINNDDFSSAEKAIKTVIEEKIKNKMKKQMSGKKKPDADGDGVPDWADKHHGEDDHKVSKKKKKK